jgi:hypothetical protein
MDDPDEEPVDDGHRSQQGRGGPGVSGGVDDVGAERGGEVLPEPVEDGKNPAMHGGASGAMDYGENPMLHGSAGHLEAKHCLR